MRFYSSETKPGFQLQITRVLLLKQSAYNVNPTRNNLSNKLDLDSLFYTNSQVPPKTQSAINTDWMRTIATAW